MKTIAVARKAALKLYNPNPAAAYGIGNSSCITFIR